MADQKHKVVKLSSGETIAFPATMPDAQVAGLITAFRQGKFNNPESGQTHTGNLHTQVSPKITENSEHLRQSGDTTPQLPAPSWNELRQYVNEKTQPTILPPLQGKLNYSQSAQDINARANNFTQNSMKRAARFLFGVVDMVPQTASTLVNLFSSDPKVSQQAESDLLSMHPGAQISDRGKEFIQDWKQSPALAGSNLTGDALGFYLAGRMGPHDISAVPVKDIPSRFRTRKIYSGPLGDVRVGTDRIPTIWMHPKAWDSLMGVLYPGENPGESHGMSLGADHNLLKLAQDRGLSQTPEFKEVQTMLEKAHREAQGQADSVAIGVKRGKGIQYAVRAMREERNHAWQRSLSQNKSIYTHLSPQGFDDVKKSIPGSMSAHLEFEGYDANSAPEMVSESAARFIGGELRGSTPEEAGEFLDKYFQQAVKEHGPKALETLEHVRGEGAKAKERINAEHNASQQGATRTGVPEVATGRQGSAGAAPQGGASQAGTTAPEIALNRQHENDDDLIGAKEAHRLFKERAAAAGINTSGGFIDGYSSNYMPINENLPNQTSANGWTVEPSIRFSDHSPANYRPTFSNWQGGTRAEFNKWADETIRDISDLRSGNLDAVNQRNDARRYAALQNAADYWRSRGDENAARSIERDIAKQQQKSQKIKSSDHALNRERPESGEAYEKLSRLRINSDLGQENTAALVTPKGKVLVGDWHTELYKESGYGDKGGEAKFFKEGGVRIRAQNNESHIEFSQIDPATVERVTNAIHALPGREVTLEYMPLGLGKGTLFSLGDKARALADLDMWARRRGAGPQHGSAAYWHQKGDAAFKRGKKTTPVADLRDDVPNGNEGVPSTGSTKIVWSTPGIGALKSQVLQQSPHKVEAPDGKTYVFPDLDSLNNFRNEAGIK